MYLLVNSEGIPLLVKYDSTISYLPVFRTVENAMEASQNLMKGASSAVQKTDGAYSSRLLEWDFFKDWQEKLDQKNIMLFLYPMSPKDFGAEQ